jgi:hypothetical protein
MVVVIMIFVFAVELVVVLVMQLCNHKTIPQALMRDPPCTGDRRSELPQLLAFLSGQGGTGKSWAVDAIRCLMKTLFRRSGTPVHVAAPTGMAAVNIGGTTMHTLLSFPVNDQKGKLRSHRLTPLTRTGLRLFRERCGGMQLLIIDEVSMVSAQMLWWVHTRLGELFGCTNVPFGGCSVILLGDLCQLPPVEGQ